jgi:hypothetical protein
MRSNREPDCVVILRLAEGLGWPEGVTALSDEAGDNPDFISGGEDWWRALTADLLAEGDETLSFRHTLQWAAAVVHKGGDPGPPATWEGSANLSLEAEDGMAIEDDGELFD